MRLLRRSSLSFRKLRQVICDLRRGAVLKAMLETGQIGQDEVDE